MKKVFKSFTFWFVLLAISEIYMNQIGRDSKNIVLIYLNPVLRMLSHSDATSAFMNSGLQVPSRTISGNISIYWYIGSVITFIIYGIIFDGIKYLFKHIPNNTK